MIYGDAKIREMARSILPSTRRKSARFDKAQAIRTCRHAVKAKLQLVAEGLDDDLDVGDLDNRRRVQTRNAMRDRRGGDKVMPLIRWAERRTAKLPLESRLSWIVSRLPKGTIGDHAKSHLDWRDHFEDPYDLTYGLWEHTYRRPPMVATFVPRLQRLAKSPYNVGVLNLIVARAHRKSWVDAKGQILHAKLDPPVLHGEGDVEAYRKCLAGAAAWRAQPERHSEWHDAAEALLDDWAAAGFDDMWHQRVFVAKG